MTTNNNCPVHGERNKALTNYSSMAPGKFRSRELHEASYLKQFEQHILKVEIGERISINFCQTIELPLTVQLVLHTVSPNRILETLALDLLSAYFFILSLALSSFIWTVWSMSEFLFVKIWGSFVLILWLKNSSDGVDPSKKAKQVVN